MITPFRRSHPAGFFDQTNGLLTWNEGPAPHPDRLHRLVAIAVAGLGGRR